MKPVLSNTNRPPTTKRHTSSEEINILYATPYIIPLFTGVRGSGILRSSAFA